MNKRIKRLAIRSLTMAMVCLFCVGAYAQSNAQMQISAQETYVNLPVTLRIQIENGNPNSPPTFPEVDGLEIRPVGIPSQRSSVTIINGRRSENRSTIYSYQFTPLREGTFEVPSISIETSEGVKKTQAFRISATTSETGDLMFAEVAGQKEKLYVGQPIELTLKIWIKPFRDPKREITISAADMWRMIAQNSQFGAFEESLQKMAAERKSIRGRTVLRKDNEGVDRSYYLFEVAARVYPKRAGQIDVEDVRVVANYPTQLGQSRDPFDSFFGDSPFGSMFDDDFFKNRGGSPFGRALTVTDSRPIAVTPEVAPIEVTPIPTAGRPADYRGAVGQYRMVTQAMPVDVKAGDPITLQIGIRGTGPMELVQAPPLSELPSLTADFKVSDEPLAGVVQDDIKLFSTSIRPRREGITQIPSIPFSFFDPDREEFVTVDSEPITIKVAKAEKLALDSIVGTSGGSRKDYASAPTSNAGPILENFTQPSLLNSQTAGPNPRFWLAVFLIPPGLLGLILVLRNGVHWNPWARNRSTYTKVVRASGPQEIAQALLGLIASKYGEPDNLTRTEAVRLLQGQVDESVLSELESVLATCERASFTGDESVSFNSIKTQASAVAKELTRIRGKVARPQRFQSPVRAAITLATAAVMLTITAYALFSVFQNQSGHGGAIGVASSATIDLDDSQRSTLLDEATAEYQRGTEIKASDAAEASSAFASAAQKYQVIVESGVHNSELYFNLGNAHLQNGSIGLAVANYQRAANLRPFNRQFAINLEAARSLVATQNGIQRTTSPWTLESIKSFLVDLPDFVWLTILAAGWIGICVCACLKLFATHLNIRYASIPAMVILVVATGMIAWTTNSNRGLPAAVIVGSNVAVHTGNGESFPTVPNHQIKEGESVWILQRRGDWLQIQAGDGIQGWAKSELVEQV